MARIRTQTVAWEIQPSAYYMIVHVFRIAVAILIVIALTFLPFLPGPYDPLAVPISSIAQVLGIIGLVFVPIGILWLWYEFRKRSAGDRNSSPRDKGYYFASASLAAATLVTALMTLAAVALSGFLLAIVMLALCTPVLARSWRATKRLKVARVENFNPAPLYLICIPTGVLLLQSSLKVPAAEFSRNYAIANSAPMIRDIEEYRRVNGRYPQSLAAPTKDYKPGVIGIKDFQYALHADAYHLFFEQSEYRFGTREIVMYNKLDEHGLPSHDSDYLLWTADQLRTRRGHYALHKASTRHWKYFWFD